jgi:hypothetical protein
VVRALNWLNVIIKKTLLEKEYKQIGRLPRFFNAKEKREITDWELYSWPGYDCQVKCLNDGFFFNVDTATKFVSMKTIWEKI